MNNTVVWSDFTTWSVDIINTSLEDKTFADVTLVTDDNQSIKAHKVIMSACSKLLGSILHVNPHPFPLLYLKGVKFKELNSIMKFVYTGNVTMDYDDVKKFMTAATDLEIIGIENAAVEKNILKSPETGNLTTNKLNLNSMANYIIEDKIENEINVIKNDWEVQAMDQENVFRNEMITTNEVLYSNNSQISGGINFSGPLESLESKQNFPKNIQQHSKIFECNLCYYTTNRRDVMNGHHSAKHDGIKYHCDVKICARVYSNKANLKQHMKSCHECAKCNYKGDFIWDLKNHKKKEH